MELSWMALAEAPEIGASSEQYCSRDNAGDRIAHMIERGLTPLIVTGPPGSGKSTELERAAHVLPNSTRCIHVHVGRFEDLGVIQPKRLLYKIVRHFIDQWVEDADGDESVPMPTVSLAEDLRASDPDFPQGEGRNRSPVQLCLNAFHEYRDAHQVDSFALLLDGLDAAKSDGAREVLRVLLPLKNVARLVIVVGPGLSNGSDNFDILTNYRLFHLSAIPSDEAGRRWMRTLVKARLPATALFDGWQSAVDRALVASGGLLRVCVELLADASRYSFEAYPDPGALEAAIADRERNMRRLVHAGDLYAMVKADGGSGLEIGPERRVRLLSQTLLIEYGDGVGTVVRPHPMLSGLIQAEGFSSKKVAARRKKRRRA